MSLPKPKLVVNLNLPTLVRIFEDIAGCLDGINTFATGAEWNINNYNHLTYPILFLEVPNSVAFDLQSNIKTIDFNFYILTQAIEGASGERIGLEPTFNSFWAELSQMEMKVTNVLQILKENYYGNFPRDFEIRALPKMQFAEDSTYGWVVGMQLILNRELDKCGIIYKSEECGPIILPGGGGGSDATPCPAACLEQIQSLSAEITELFIRINELEQGLVITNENLLTVTNTLDQFAIDTDNNFQNVFNNINDLNDEIDTIDLTLISLQNQINNISPDEEPNLLLTVGASNPPIKLLRPYRGVVQNTSSSNVLTQTISLHYTNRPLVVTGIRFRVGTNAGLGAVAFGIYDFQQQTPNNTPLMKDAFILQNVTPAPGNTNYVVNFPAITIPTGYYFVGFQHPIGVVMMGGNSRTDALMTDDVGVGLNSLITNIATPLVASYPANTTGYSFNIQQIFFTLILQ